MKQNRKYFGMTPAQLGILAGLAGLACLLFGLTGWFALRGISNPLARAPHASRTSIPQSTATPFVLPTLTPTQTPTPIPYEMLIPDGWIQFKTGLAEIWLPSDFRVGDTRSFSDSANSAAMRELIVRRPKSKSALYQIFVMISYEPLVGNSLDDYLDSQVAALPSSIHMAERRKVSVNSTEVVRFVFETRNKNIDVNDLSYVFLDGTTVWYVEYVAQINEFYEMLSTFEDSAKTFRVLK